MWRFKLQTVYTTNMYAMTINIMRKGSNTRNHDRGVTPALQMRLRIQVHRRITKIFIIKTMKVLETWQL